MFRLDRFITLFLARPLRRLLPQGDTGAIPVLMYHSITDDPEPGVPPYYQVNTTPAAFRRQVQCLADGGYQTVTLSQALTHLENTKSQPAGTRLAVITFDDGFRNFYTEAFPALRQQGFTATMFLPTAFIGDTPRPFSPRGGSARPASNPEMCLTWSEVRELHAAGIEIGSHTATHPQLADLGWEEVRVELTESKSAIESRLGESISSFCYPYAFPQANRPFRERLAGLLREAGYTCCATTGLGRTSPGNDKLALKRLPANSLDDLHLLRAKLAGDYDWLQFPQSMLKGLRANRHDS